MAPAKNRKGKSSNQKSHASSNEKKNTVMAGQHNPQKISGSAWKAERRVHVHFILITYMTVSVAAAFANLYKMNWYLWEIELMLCCQATAIRYPYFIMSRSYYRRLEMKPTQGTADFISLFCLVFGALALLMTFVKCFYVLMFRHSYDRLMALLLPIILELVIAPFYFMKDRWNAKWKFSSLDKTFFFGKPGQPDDADFNLPLIVHVGIFTTYYACFLPVYFGRGQNLVLHIYQFYFMVTMIFTNVTLILVVDILLTGKGQSKVITEGGESNPGEANLSQYLKEQLFRDPGQMLFFIQLVCSLQIVFEMVAIYTSMRWESHCLVLTSLLPIVNTVSSFSIRK